MRLENKVAIVTGAAAGVGRAIALRFANEGARVAVMDIDAEAAEATVSQIGDDGGTAFAIVADVASLEEDRRVVRETAERFGRIDVLINNAGLPSQYAVGTSHEVWNLGIEVSLSSVFRMTDAAADHLASHGNGAIVNICSIAGTKVGVAAPWYAAAKAGITGLTRSLAVTYGPRGVRVNALCLGTITTQRTQFLRADDRAYADFVARTPLGRFGEPEEAASAALFMASDEASYLTGDVITLDGGRTVAL